jgi:hypothetical protein
VVVSCEPTPATEAHPAPLVRALLRMLHRPLSPEEDFWEVASIAANLHVFTPAQLRTMATGAGYREVSLSTRYFCATLLLTASYVTHSRRPALARAGTVAAAGIARFQPGRRGDQPGAARNVAPRRRRRTAPLKPEGWPQLRHVERSVAEFAPNTFRTAFIPLQPYQATAAAALSDHRHQRR